MLVNFLVHSIALVIAHPGIGLNIVYFQRKYHPGIV